MEKDNNVWLLILIGIVILVFLLGTFGMGGYGMMGFGMGFGFLLMLLFLVAVVWLIITLASGIRGIREDESDALNILKKRYAKGDISKGEYEEMKKELS